MIDAIKAALWIASCLTVLIVLCPGSEDFKADILAVYQIRCMDSNFDPQDGECRGKHYAYKTLYRVFPAQKRVVSQALFEYQDCTIFDANNWSCQDGNHVISATDGRFVDFFNPARGQDYKLVMDKNGYEWQRSPVVARFVWRFFRFYTILRDFIGH